MQEQVIRALEARGVTIDDIAEIVYTLQKPYVPQLTLEMCRQSVKAVLAKREAQHAILTGLALDVFAETGSLPSPLQEIVSRDEPLYGVDEILALAITNIYGSVGLMSFGYLDKRKLGIIGRLNSNAHSVHTFLTTWSLASRQRQRPASPTSLAVCGRWKPRMRAPPPASQVDAPFVPRYNQFQGWRPCVWRAMPDEQGMEVPGVTPEAHDVVSGDYVVIKALEDGVTIIGLTRGQGHQVPPQRKVGPR